MKYIHKNKNHWQRRLFHLVIGLTPLIYYKLTDPISSLLHLSPIYWLSTLAIVIIILEGIRIKKGWLFYGQREYEKNEPSAFMWTCLGVILVLLCAPPYQGQKGAFVQPIIWSLTLGDPLLGECRRARVPVITTLLVTLLVLSLVWILAVFWYELPYWLIFIMPTLAIIGEWPQIRWIDDNFMMVFLPLVFIKLFF